MQYFKDFQNKILEVPVQIESVLFKMNAGLVLNNMIKATDDVISFMILSLQENIFR